MTKTHGRMFEGLQIVDAKKELRVFVNKTDTANAIKKDPANCAFSNACRRLYGTRAVVFFRTLAYVELPNGRGGTRIERFYLTDKTRELIAKFDKTGKFSPDGYALLPPSKQKTLDALLKSSKEYRESGMKGLAEERRRGRPIKNASSDIRSGKGVVQFISHEKTSLRKAFAGIS
jgi:hypothetical protein